MKNIKSNDLSSWLSLFVVVIGTFMSILDSSIVNIAVPKMMSVFGISMDNAKWILTAYTLSLGAIIPLTGYLQDIFGSKRIYIFALTMFTIGSLLCGFSWNFSSMVIFRIIQAIGGGMIMPVGMSIIYDIFPREKIGLALGFWGIASMAAPAIGPTLGGYIIESMDWRLIFNINVPIGILGVFMAIVLLKNSKINYDKHFDLIGFLSSTIGIVSILYVLGEGSSIDWDKIENPILIVIGILNLILFVFNELTHDHPLLELRIFKKVEFSISQIISCVLTFSLMGGAYILPLFLQNLRNYTPMQTGIIMLPSALVVGIMMPISGNIYDKFGAKIIVLPGLFLLAISSYMLSNSITMESSKEHIIFITCLRSIGLGLAMMPINTAGMNVIPKELVGKASAISNTIRQISSALSVTIMSTIMQSKTDFNLLQLSEQITLYNNFSNDLINNYTKIFSKLVNLEISKSLAFSQISSMIQIQAILDAMKFAVAITSISVIISMFLTFFMKNKNPY